MIELFFGFITRRLDHKGRSFLKQSGLALLTRASSDTMQCNLNDCIGLVSAFYQP